MPIKYLLFLFIVTHTYSVCFGQKIKDTNFYDKGENVYNVKYYILNNANRVFELQNHNNKIVFPDTITTEYLNLMVAYESDIIVITNFNYQDALYLNIYYDNRICQNSVNRKYGGYSKLKNIFRHRYLIDDGSGYVTITPRSPKKWAKKISLETTF